MKLAGVPPLSQQLSPQLRLGFLQSFHFVSAKPPNVEFNFGGPGHGAPIAVPFAEHPPVPASPIAEEQYPSQTPFPRNHVFKMFVPKQMQARQHSNGTQRTSSPAIVAAAQCWGCQSSARQLAYTMNLMPCSYLDIER